MILSLAKAAASTSIYPSLDKQHQENKDKISLIIMDVVIPEMGGVDAALKIRAINHQAKIIFCTGYDDKNLLDESVLQWTKVLSKPYSIDSFSQHIKESISDYLPLSSTTEKS